MNIDKAARRLSDEKNGIAYHGVAGLLLSSPLRRARHNPEYTYGAPNVKPVPSTGGRTAIAPPPKVTAAKRARTRLRPEGLIGLVGPSPTYSADGRTPNEEVMMRGRLSAYCLCADLDTTALMAAKSARVKITQKSSSSVVMSGMSDGQPINSSSISGDGGIGGGGGGGSLDGAMSPLLGNIKNTINHLPTSAAVREGKASRGSIRGFKALNTYDGVEGIGPEGNWKSTMHGGDIVHSIMRDASYTMEPVIDVDPMAFIGRDKHVMYFPYGCVVFWGCDVVEEEMLLGELKPYMKRPVTRDEFDNSHDDLDYVLQCHRTSEESTELVVESDLDKQTKFGRNIKYDTIFLETRDPYEKLSYAVAMAQSAKLSVFEDRLEQTIELNRKYPETLAQTGVIGLTDKQINRMIGKVLVERNEVNLHSDILDTPDFFWEMDRFEPHYDKLCRYLDIPSRVTVLNQRFEILERSLNVMQMQLTTKHSAKLEWIVIWLIVVEVALELIWGILVKDILGWYK